MLKNRSVIVWIPNSILSCWIIIRNGWFRIDCYRSLTRHRLRPGPRNWMDGLCSWISAWRHRPHHRHLHEMESQWKPPTKLCFLLSMVRHGPNRQPQPRTTRKPMERILMVDVYRVFPMEPWAQLKLQVIQRQGWRHPPRQNLVRSKQRLLPHQLDQYLKRRRV